MIIGYLQPHVLSKRTLERQMLIRVDELGTYLGAGFPCKAEQALIYSEKGRK